MPFCYRILKVLSSPFQDAVFLLILLLSFFVVVPQVSKQSFCSNLSQSRQNLSSHLHISKLVNKLIVSKNIVVENALPDGMCLFVIAEEASVIFKDSFFFPGCLLNPHSI